MYLAGVVVANVPTARWDQPNRNKKSVDFGQPVLVGFGPVPMNPVQLVIVLAHGISKGTRSGDRLRGLYEIWVSRPA